MAYIPVGHQKYDILPLCRERGGEVFSYSSDLENEIRELLPDKESVIPYGYDSYEEFDKQLDDYIFQHGTEDGKLNRLGQLLTAYKADIKRRNVKENWSVVKYAGESTGSVSGLIHDKYYYWPCSIEDPEYEGVVDDEEFTSYLYSTDSHLWEIAEDPTGMAHRTIIDGKNSMSTNQYTDAMEQIKNVLSQTIKTITMDSHGIWSC